jgi:hypothetical protein
MMIEELVLKPDRKLKVWRKSSEVWRPECIGYVAEPPSNLVEIRIPKNFAVCILILISFQALSRVFWKFKI